LKINDTSFYKSFANISTLPASDLPEIAFVGRSNVGKSSLINDLTGKKIAMTSSTPGKTRLINFFLVNKSFYFVDLPGYGYAKISKSMKVEWEGFVEKYLETRTQLKIIIFLLDIRRSPNEQDLLLNKWFKELPDVKTVHVLTKADKLNSNEKQKQKTKIALDLFTDISDFVLYSVPKKTGRFELLKKIQSFLE
jgi:GTP-binding protein